MRPLAYSRTSVVPYAADHFFSVVLAVDKYQEFVPWCVESAVLHSKHNRFIGRLTAQFLALRFSYDSEVTFGKHHIQSVVKNCSVFKSLTSRWSVRPHGEHDCQVTYELEMQFANSFFRSLGGSFLDLWTTQIHKAFLERCQAISPPPKHNLVFSSHLEEGGLWRPRPSPRCQEQKEEKLSSDSNLQFVLQSLAGAKSLQSHQLEEILALCEESSTFKQQCLWLSELHTNSSPELLATQLRELLQLHPSL